MKPLNLIYVTIFLTFGFTTAANAQSSNNHNSLELNNDKSSSTTGAKCREGCLEKYSIKEILCSQQRECAMCWDKCTSNFKIRVNTDSSHRLALKLIKMIRNESVVTADVTWSMITGGSSSDSNDDSDTNTRALSSSESADNVFSKTSKIIQAISQQFSSKSQSMTNTPTSSSSSSATSANNIQCLVTWEVSGGGLMGNLLTESSNVQLSLWPDTNYHVRVTCRNKLTDVLERSLPMTIDTSNAVNVNVKRIIVTTPSTPTLILTEELDTEAPEEAVEDIDEYENISWPKYRGQLIVSQYDSYLILALFVSILVFILIVLNIVIFIKRKNLPSNNDKILLIDNEALSEILHV